MVKNARRRRLMKMHRNAVIFVVPAFALLTSWMQKSFKNVKNSPKNDHKKYEARFCNGQTRASAEALISIVPRVALLTHFEVF